MGETFRGDVSVLEDASILRSKALTLVEPHLEEAPFVEFCGDVVMGTNTPSIEHTDHICKVTPISSPLLPTSPSHLYADHRSLSDLRG